MDLLEDTSFQKEVDTVRALHQTVVSLRAALEASRVEIEELKGRIWSSESCEIALQTLSVENHILRQKIINIHEFKENTTQTSIPYITIDHLNDENINRNSKDTSFDENSLKTDFSDSFVTEIKTSPRKTTASPRKTIDSDSSVNKTSRETTDSERTAKNTVCQQISPRKSPLKSKQSKTVAADYIKTSEVLEEKKIKQKSPRKIYFQDISPRKSPNQNIESNLTSSSKFTEQSHKKSSTSLKNKDFESEPAININLKILSPRKSSKDKELKTKSSSSSNSNELAPRKSPTKATKNKQLNQNIAASNNDSDLLKTQSESPRSSKNQQKNTKQLNPPHQTLITVNLTLKSPSNAKKQKKHEPVSSDSSSEVNNQLTMEEQNTNAPEETSEKDLEAENEEVDDIELIFTTDETTTVIKEELVSIADESVECDTPVLLNYKTVDFDAPDFHLSCENMDKDLEDDVFHENEATDNFENENTENLSFQHISNSKSDNSINRENENESQRDKSLKSCYSYQDSSFESRSLDKDESFDKFDDKDKYLHNMWSNNSVLVETDISKCGIVDSEPPINTNRRNTCPNPVPYRPIMHREAIKHRSFAVKFTSSPRPILNETQSPKTESEAQTDISALPNFWKSESYLAHKVHHQFTTLPSKYPMPISQKSLRLSEKTKEARRVLLSDINFTSMVPELSRSADHLYQEGQEQTQTCGYGQYLNPNPQMLRRYNTGDSLTSPNFAHSQKFTWSPSDYSNFSSTKFDNSNMYLNRYRGSLTSINMQNSFDLPDNIKRRSYSSSNWRHNVPASFDNSRFSQTGHGPYRSVPNSPTRSRTVPFSASYQHYSPHFKHSNSRFGKPGFSGYRYINGSLPELHGDLDSGDSTDSLVEEAEQYLRSSIDCIVSGRDISQTQTRRRASAPCPTRDSSPPRNWQPFLPHGIKDLRSDNWVKVIGPEGKIRGGRIRYVGYVLGQQEPYVGLELASNVGNSDGSFNNRKYFDCSPNHALFIPFKKVVMGWRN